MDKIKKDYIIIGAGGHGAVIADILYNRGFSLIGFLDDNLKIGTDILGTKVLGKIETCLDHSDCMFIIGIGDNTTRQKIALTYPIQYGSAIHPSAIIGEQVKIGLGSVLMAGTILNPRTTIGSHCIINTGACLDHDNTLEDFVHISPKVVSGGSVTVGSKTHVGIGAVIKNNVTICPDTTIGAGAVVVNNITQPATYVGVPAVPISFYSSRK